MLISICFTRLCCCAGVIFFGLVLGSGPLTPWLATLGLTPLMAAVLVGGAQNVFSKSAKYSLFDPCKEMAYIPLDQETQLKGKAAIDVVCNPLGKSGGALIQQAMIVGFGSLAASTPYLGVILGVIVFAWLKAAGSLSKQFSALEIKEQRAKLAEEGLRPGKKYQFVSKVNEQVSSQLPSCCYLPLCFMYTCRHVSYCVVHSRDDLGAFKSAKLQSQQTLHETLLTGSPCLTPLLLVWQCASWGCINVSAVALRLTNTLSPVSLQLSREHVTCTLHFVCVWDLMADMHLQGFIEGKYELIEDGASVPAGTEVLSAEEIAAKKTGTTPKDPEKLSSA